MRNVLDVEIEIAAFDIHVLSDGDPRLESAKRLPNVKVYSAPGPFINPACLLPPIPSNAYYDAKLWESILREGADHDIWWNVAR